MSEGLMSKERQRAVLTIRILFAVCHQQHRCNYLIRHVHESTSLSESECECVSM